MNQAYVKHLMQHQMAQRQEVAQRLYGMLVCPKCERLAFRHEHRNHVRCPVCGYEGPGNMKVSEHIKHI